MDRAPCGHRRAACAGLTVEQRPASLSKNPPKEFFDFVEKVRAGVTPGYEVLAYEDMSEEE